jgi:hypothetical protein
LIVSLSEVGDLSDRLGLPIPPREVASIAQFASVHVAQVSLIARPLAALSGYWAQLGASVPIRCGHVRPHNQQAVH